MPKAGVVEGAEARMREVQGYGPDGVGMLECLHRRWLAPDERRVGHRVVCQLCPLPGGAL